MNRNLIIIFLSWIVLSSLLFLYILAKNSVVNTEQYSLVYSFIRKEKFDTRSIFLDEETRILYESNGGYNKSNLLIRSYPDMTILKKVVLPRDYSAQSVVKCGNYIYQFTTEDKVYKFTLNLVFIETLQANPRIIGFHDISMKDDHYLVGTNGRMLFILDCKNNLEVTKEIVINFNKQDESSQLTSIATYNENLLATTDDNKLFFVSFKHRKAVYLCSLISLYKTELLNQQKNEEMLAKTRSLKGIEYDKATDVLIITGREWGYFHGIKLH